MKNVVITGCNRGLGEGICQAFLDNGYDVYGLNKTPSTINHSHYTNICCDVSQSGENYWQNIRRNLPFQIDVLVVNAGIRRFDFIRTMNFQDWQDSVDTNLNGVFYVVKTLISDVINSDGDVIVIGSHSEKYTFEKGAAYCSTKGALKEFAECLMKEVRYDNVRVSYLSLGSIKNRDHHENEEWKLKPIEVGQTIVSLVSLPKNVMIPYLDVRPIMPLKSDISGMDRLQYV
jgi:NADP-dependent 3-hydroxy acid dehydrogenase YdfG